MNTRSDQMTDHDDVGELQQYLQQLPTPRPALDQWPRIERSRRRRQWQRRAVGGFAGTGALALLLALLPGPPANAPKEAVAEAQAAPVAPRHPQQLRQIDRQLQAAYDRGADAEQLEALWQVRERAAQTPYQQDSSDVEIIRL